MITGEKVKLKRLVLDDIDKMINWGKHEDPMFFDYNFMELTMKEKEHWYLQKNGYGKKCFCIFNERNKLVGYIALRKLNYVTKSGEIGMVMDPENMNKGYGQDALKAFLNWYFYEYDFHVLTLIVGKYNKRAIKCYENVGFEKKKEYYGEFYNKKIDPFDGNFKEFEDCFRKNLKNFETIYYKMLVTQKTFEEKRLLF